MGLISLFLSVVFGIVAQNNNEQIKKEINKIKMSRSYLCAEATMPEEEEANNLAGELLINEITQWLSEKKKNVQPNQIVLQDISSLTETLDMRRGANVRVFIYIKKKDIIPVYGNGLVLSKEEEELTTDENREIKKEETNYINDKKVTASPIERIVSAKDMNDIKIIFNELKHLNSIDYGKYTSLEQDINNAYLLIYNKEGKIVAVLDNTNSRTNLQTKQPDKLSNYNGNAVYWFILK